MLCGFDKANKEATHYSLKIRRISLDATGPLILASPLVLPDTNTVTFPHPFVVSLSNLERSHFDKLSANGGSQ